MANEILKNNPSTTLNGAISATTTSIIVNSIIGFPTSGNFTIRIDGEILKVTAVSGTTWTVRRATEEYAGVQAANTHSNGAPVNLVFSSDAFFELTQKHYGGLTTASLGTPSAPTVTPQGTAGSSHYTYKIVALNAAGNNTVASSATQTLIGNATLDGTNYNRLTWSSLPGTASYDVYRTATNGTPASVGKIGNTTNTTFDDIGLAGDASSAPSTDKSYFSGVNTTIPSQAFDVTGSGQFSEGVNVGFSGTPTAKKVLVGDVNFGLDASNLVSNTWTTLNFDSDTNFIYVRAAHALFCTIGGAFVFSLDITGAFAAAGNFNLGTTNISTNGAALVWYVGDGFTANAARVFMRISTTTFQLFGHTTGSDVLWATINSSAGWSAASSKEGKSNIRNVLKADLEILRNQLLNIECKHFIRNDDLNSFPEVGIIAEESPALILGDAEATTVNPVRWLGFLTSIMQKLTLDVARLKKDPIIWEARMHLDGTAGFDCRWNNRARTFDVAMQLDGKGQLTINAKGGKTQSSTNK